MKRTNGFLLEIVEPTVREFLGRRGDIRLGFLAAIVLNQTAHYWAHDGHVPKDPRMRDQIRKESPDFALIHDIADASKHVVLGRKSRRLTSMDQASSPGGLFQEPFGEGVFNEAWVVTVTLDDRTTVLLDELVESVLSFWKVKISSATP
jgi:hypothetical protein